MRSLKRLRDMDAHHLSIGISTLKNIATKDHGDCDTWMNPSQPTEVLAESLLRPTGGTEHNLDGYRNIERIHPVVEEGTGREEKDLSGPI